MARRHLIRFLRRRPSFTVREAADIGRAAWRVVVPWTMPRIEISIDGAPPLEAQRLQLRLRRLHEIQERISGGLLAIAVLMIGLADMVRTWNRSLDHMALLLAAAIAAGLAARILGKALVRIRVLAELLRLRWKVGRWSVGREVAEPPVRTIDQESSVPPAHANTQTEVLRGSCACGAIAFTLSSRPLLMGTCHCTGCRKAGASTFVIVKRSSFKLIAGADALVTCRPEAPHAHNRSFCSRCGTAMGEVGTEEPSFSLPANCFDDEPGISNGYHAFVSEKPGWYAICDEAKQFARNPPA